MKREQVASLVGFYAQRLLPGALGILALPWLFEVAGPITYQRYSLVILLMEEAPSPVSAMKCPSKEKHPV